MLDILASTGVFILSVLTSPDPTQPHEDNKAPDRLLSSSLDPFRDTIQALPFPFVRQSARSLLLSVVDNPPTPNQVRRRKKYNRFPLSPDLDFTLDIKPLLITPLPLTRLFSVLLCCLFIFA